MDNFNLRVVENGYIISYEEIMDEHTAQCTKVEFLVEDNEYDEFGDLPKKTIEKVLYKVAELLGVTFEPLKNDNLNITWDKYGQAK